MRVLRRVETPSVNGSSTMSLADSRTRQSSAAGSGPGETQLDAGRDANRRGVGSEVEDREPRRARVPPQARRSPPRHGRARGSGGPGRKARPTTPRGRSESRSGLRAYAGRARCWRRYGHVHSPVADSCASASVLVMTASARRSSARSCARCQRPMRRRFGIVDVHPCLVHHQRERHAGRRLVRIESQGVRARTPRARSGTGCTGAAPSRASRRALSSADSPADRSARSMPIAASALATRRREYSSIASMPGPTRSAR